MANRIKMEQEQAIYALLRQGWSQRKTARELGIHRYTVARYAQLAAGQSKCTTLTAGSESGTQSKCTTPTAGSESGIQPKCTTPTTGFSGQPSFCEPFRQIITPKLELGLTAQRIYQDLVSESGFNGSYESVKRFARRLRQNIPLPFRRIEVEPGQEGQIDFGRGNYLEGPDGRRRPVNIFRIVLSCSRKGYSESLARQDTESFIRAIENAFWYFGGVPKVLVIDNLRAAVSHADWYDPEVNPKIASFCRHYGCIIMPTRPYTPRHKGKIERGVGYVENNALKGRLFKSIEELNPFLLGWENDVADTRIHGTTRQQVKKLFEEQERPALQPLPAKRFPFFHEGERQVHRDGHVEVDKSYYSVPPEYVGRAVWARFDSRMVHIYNNRFESIAVHAKKQPGQFSTRTEHIDTKKISMVEHGAVWLLSQAGKIGPNAGKWAKQVLESRGIPGMRVLQGLAALARKYGPEEIDRACAAAFSHDAFRLKYVRALIRKTPEPAQLELLQEHPIIRPMSEYANFVKIAVHDGTGVITIKPKEMIS